MANDTNKDGSISLVENLSIKFTRSVGTPTSIVLHTIFFIGIFSLEKFGFSLDQILLVLTTAVSLEAIYLAIFIQMTVNRQETRLHEVGEDIDEIHEDVEELGKDIDEIQEDLGEISEDVDDISKDIDEISEDVDELSEEDSNTEAADRERLQKIEESLKALVAELAELRTRK